MAFDYPGKHLDDLSFKEREIRWLWERLGEIFGYNHLSTYYPDVNNIEQIKETLDKEIRRAIEWHEDNNGTALPPLVWIQQHQHTELLPIAEFGWIRDAGIRAISLIRHNIHKLSDFNNPPYAVRPHYIQQACPSPLEELILQIDMQRHISFDAKRRFLSQCQTVWSDIFTNDKYVKWIDKNNEEQLEWAWNYLRNSNPYVQFGAPTTKESLYDEIAIAIDKIHDPQVSSIPDTFHHPDNPRMELFIAKMKKSWSQQKYRNSDKARKPITFGANQTTRKRLEKIVEHERKHINDVMQSLIDNEYERIYPAKKT